MKHIQTALNTGGGEGEGDEEEDEDEDEDGGNEEMMGGRCEGRIIALKGRRSGGFVYV